MLTGSQFDAPSPAFEIVAATDVGDEAKVSLAQQRERFPGWNHTLQPRRIEPPRALRPRLRGATDRAIAVPENARWQEQNGAEQRKQGFDRNTHQTKWQGYEPHQRPEKDGEDGQRPAHHQQQAPDEKQKYG